MRKPTFHIDSDETGMSVMFDIDDVHGEIALDGMVRLHLDPWAMLELSEALASEIGGFADERLKRRLRLRADL